MRSRVANARSLLVAAAAAAVALPACVFWDLDSWDDNAGRGGSTSSSSSSSGGSGATCGCPDSSAPGFCEDFEHPSGVNWKIVSCAKGCTAAAVEAAGAPSPPKVFAATANDVSGASPPGSAYWQTIAPTPFDEMTLSFQLWFADPSAATGEAILQELHFNLPGDGVVRSRLSLSAAGLVFETTPRVDGSPAFDLHALAVPVAAGSWHCVRLTFRRKGSQFVAEVGVDDHDATFPFGAEVDAALAASSPRFDSYVFYNGIEYTNGGVGPFSIQIDDLSLRAETTP